MKNHVIKLLIVLIVSTVSQVLPAQNQVPSENLVQQVLNHPEVQNLLGCPDPELRIVLSDELQEGKKLSLCGIEIPVASTNHADPTALTVTRISQESDGAIVNFRYLKKKKVISAVFDVKDGKFRLQSVSIGDF